MPRDLRDDPAAEALSNPDKITEALRLAAQDALRLHKQTGNPVCGWRDGQVVWIPPDEIELDDE